MKSLSNSQKELILDYCLGQTDPEQIDEVRSLISSNSEAAELNAKLKSSLAPLETVEPQECPWGLAESTVEKLKDAVNTSNNRLENLIAAEQAKTGPLRFRFTRNFGDLTAIAAVIVLVIGILIPAVSKARQKYWQKRCEINLVKIYNGLHSYTSDHNERLPAVATTPGAPWWKVGYQGKENHSNTRPLWLLVKNDYVRPVNFVCPGRRESKPNFETLQVKNYNDFPDRDFITVSVRLRCDKMNNRSFTGRKVLMADRNPLTEMLPVDYSQPLKIKLDEQLLSRNSINHRGKGQNVIFCDGSVDFAKTRQVGSSEDDFFSLQNMSLGSEVNGCEIPSCESDAFLAP